MKIKKQTTQESILLKLDLIESYCIRIQHELSLYKAANEYLNNKMNRLLDESNAFLSNEKEKKKKKETKQWAKQEGLCAKCLQPCSVCNALVIKHCSSLANLPA